MIYTRASLNGSRESCWCRWIVFIVLFVSGAIAHSVENGLINVQNTDSVNVTRDYSGSNVVDDSEKQPANGFILTEDSAENDQSSIEREGGNITNLSSNDHNNTQDNQLSAEVIATSVNITNENETIRWPLEQGAQKLENWLSQIGSGDDSREAESASSNPTPTSMEETSSPAPERSSVPPEPLRRKDCPDCILGKSELYLSWWVNTDGSLRDSSIISETGSEVNLFVDLSDSAKTELSILEKLLKLIYERRTPISDQSQVVFMSLANNHLARAPYSSLVLVNGTLEYLSLAGNKFNIFNSTSVSDDNWATFPEMDKLRELDLRNCSIQAIDDQAFHYMGSLQKMYLSENNLFAISANTFLPLSNLVHLDMSFIEIKYQLTNFQPDIFDLYTRGLAIDEYTFEALPKLKFMDLSYTRLEATSIKAFARIPEDLEQLSLCYTGIPVIGYGMFEKTKNLKVLDLSGNSPLTTTLRRDSFQGLEESLEILSIENSNLKSLSWLNHLRSLKMLKLNSNNINQLSNDTFAKVKSLQILDLGGNHISNWYFRVFTSNPDLRILDLRQNNINVITSEMMKDFEKLEFLGIGGNSFICNCLLRDVFDEAMYNSNPDNSNGFTKTVPNIDDILIEEALKKYMDNIGMARELEENLPSEYMIYDSFSRIYTTYYQKSVVSGQNIESTQSKYHLVEKHKFSRKNFRKFKRSTDTSAEYLTDNAVEFSFQLLDFDEAYYICFNSTTNDEYLFTDLESCLLERMAEWSAIAQQLIQTNNSFSTVIIVVFVVMFVLCICYYKWWYIRYFLILIKNATILSFLDKESNQGSTTSLARRSFGEKDFYLYDVFVSYCDENRDWVLDELLPNIEQRQEISICLHERDFQVGISILENIISCMDRSKCLLLVVSQSFLLSQWCQFEMHLAQHRLLETCREQLVLILLEDIPKRKRPKTLEYLMKTKTYIKWPAVEIERAKSKSERSRCIEDERKIFWKRLRRALIEHDWEPSDSTYV